MRLFIAVRPAPAVVDVLRALDRPALPGVRWTTEDQWHVTLRFLGEVADPGSVVLPAGAARAVALGDRTVRLNPSVLAVPVEGLDDLAAAAGAESFRGHLTLARARRGVPPELVGSPVPPASWIVRSVHLVRSETRPEGARYVELAEVDLAPGA